ncbi:MAG: hypothetical protein EZS28_050726 [Streblomastix strix]|uniref:Uncharacterized protein n=1 Tax=Streblomastix strix TaxID=222440 RepID=A0A5J4T682_9EUKA|nr:MAG: hypothetical protein EZS28_050726 [Streblomastix strix]
MKEKSNFSKKFRRDPTQEEINRAVIDRFKTNPLFAREIKIALKVGGNIAVGCPCCVNLDRQDIVNSNVYSFRERLNYLFDDMCMLSRGKDGITAEVLFALQEKEPRLNQFLQNYLTITRLNAKYKLLPIAAETETDLFAYYENYAKIVLEFDWEMRMKDNQSQYSIQGEEFLAKENMLKQLPEIKEKNKKNFKRLLSVIYR